MTPTRQLHPKRCETCKNLWKTDCPYYAWIKTGEVGISCDSYMDFTAIVGCCSHSSTHSITPAAERVMLCFGNYWTCPIDEEECKVSDPCHQKAIRDREDREQAVKSERERVLGAFDQKKEIENCEACRFRPRDLADCELVNVAILSISDWEKFCPLKKIEESLRAQPEEQRTGGGAR